MADLSPAAFNATIAIFGLLLYLFAWRATRDLPSAARVLARMSLAVVALAPFILAIFFGASAPKQEQSAGSSAPNQTRSAPPQPGQADDAQRRAAEAADARRAAEEAQRQTASKAERAAESQVRKAAPPQVDPAPPAGGSAPPASTAEAPRPAPPPAPITAAPPPPPASPAPIQKEESRGSAATPSADAPSTRSMAPPPEAAPVASPDYDVVPVFYGTDRGAKVGEKRVSYDSDRAKRLELGRAMVTVPKVHEVPNIERPWVYRIPLTNVILYQETEDPKKHFTMQEVKALSKEEYLALVRERLAASKKFKDHAVVFIHGFNTTFDFAVYRAAQMAYDLQFDGAPFVYSWPSKGQLGLQDYGYDRGSAEQAEPYLKEFLSLITRETGAKSVSIIAHSMGNLVLLPVLREMKNSAPPGVEISQIILAAPDVDRDRFENLAAEIKSYAKGTTLYVASNDWALELSKRLAGSVARAGDMPVTGPLLIPGIDTIDITATSSDMFSLHHSGYAEKTALINDIQLIIQTGERPPDMRVPILQKITTDKGVYWRYPSAR
jgi:esterase/lipase superfamily enzyme